MTEPEPSAAQVTPTVPAVAPKPPRRWLGPRGGWWLLLIGGGTLTGFLIYDLIISPAMPEYRSLPVTSLVIGSFLAVVCVFYTMLYRLKPADGVSPAMLFGALAVAGIATTFAAARVEVAIGGALAPHLSGAWAVTPTLALFAGPVEETLKLLTVLLIGLALKTKGFRSGLYLGGAVGLGFAAIENLMYLTNGWEHPLAHFSQVGMLAYISAARTIITPLLHPIFTSIAAGVLFAAVRNNRYRVTVPVVGTLLAVMGLHSLWDTIGISLGSLHGHVLPVIYGLLVLLGIGTGLGLLIALPIVWRVIVRHMSQTQLSASSAHPAEAA